MIKAKFQQQASSPVKIDRERVKAVHSNRKQTEITSELTAAFETVFRRHIQGGRQVTIHVGPTNSGKTYNALQHLQTAQNGVYLAPLRLLAWEVQDRLTNASCPTTLLTGEEQRVVEDARVVSSTIEMLDVSREYDIAVIDEAQLVGDDQRGWAWARALLELRTQHLHLICAPFGLSFLRMICDQLGDEVTVKEYHRLVPLHVTEDVYDLDELPERSIVVCFTRRQLLCLQRDLVSRYAKPCAAIYGALPPDVRRGQVAAFLEGEAPYCVATDAIGMGMNLPADNVVFFDTRKFDGKHFRRLHPMELQQIAGRSGRFGFANVGYVGAINPIDHENVHIGLGQQPPEIPFGYLAPSVEELSVLPGSLFQRLVTWRKLVKSIQPLGPVFKAAPMEEILELANLLTESDIRRFGLDKALIMVQSPATECVPYWQECVKAMRKQRPLPVPPPFKEKITSYKVLTEAEYTVRCYDLYAWLSYRLPEAQGRDISRQRAALCAEIDHALLSQIDLSPHCLRCGKPMSAYERYSICEQCYAEGNTLDLD